MNLSKPLILASASPRRSELLSLAGIPFTVQVSGCEESATKTAPDELVMELSRQKAEAVAFDLHEPCYILGADTVVACGGEILGKPADAADAERMIRLIAGRVHQVYTGVTILNKSAHSAGTGCTFAVRTDVHVAPMSDEEIAEYIQAGAAVDSRPLCSEGAASGSGPVSAEDITADGSLPGTENAPAGLSPSALPEWKDKAGAYAIQGIFGSRFITAIDGDYYNVVGLPVGRVYRELKKMEG